MEDKVNTPQLTPVPAHYEIQAITCSYILPAEKILKNQ